MAYSNLYLPGTVKAWPAGLESTLTYRGLVLNDLSQPDRYKIKSINGLFDPEVRDSRENNPSRHGETAYASFYGGKQIVIQGTIYAGNLAKLRNMISALQAAFSDIGNEYPLYFTTFGNQAYINCKKSAQLEIEESFNKRMPQHEFQITLRASDPFIYGVTENTASITPTQISTRGRIYNGVYNRTYSSYPVNLDSVVVTNNGNFNNLPRFKITGAFQQAAIINYTTGQKIIINASMADNFYLTYSLRDNTIVDINNISRTDVIDFASDNLYLAPGANSIGFSVNSYTANTKLDIYYRDTYI